MKVMIQNSSIKGYHEFKVRSHKDLEMLILMTPILLPTRVILYWWYERSKVHSCGRKNIWIERMFYLGWCGFFGVVAPCHNVISHHTVKFRVDRTFLFIIRLHMITWSKNCMTLCVVAQCSKPSPCQVW